MEPIYFRTKARIKLVFLTASSGSVRAIYLDISTFILIYSLIVTRNCISDEVYKSWNTQLLIAGSDSTDDESGKQLTEIEGDESDDFDKPLMSSISNLNLFDDPHNLKVLDSKGKGRYIPSTPHIESGVGSLHD